MSSPGESLRRAGALIQQGRAEAARELLDRCLDEHPEQIAAHQLLAMIEVRAGNLDAAGRHAETYLERRPDDGAAWYNLGFIRQRQQRFESALNAYRRARELAPDHLPSAINMAQVLERIGQTQSAIDVLDQILAGDPGLPVAANALASILIRAGRPGRARSLAEAALERDANDAVSWMNLGIALAHDGDPAAAVARYRRALELRPGYPAARLNLAKALTRTGELAGALDEIDRALEDRPDQGEAWSVRAVVLERLGRDTEALAAARRATELLPRDAHAWFNLASLLSGRTDADDLRAAEEAVRTCLGLAPEHGQAHRCLAIVLAKQGRLDEAIASARKAGALAPGPAVDLTLGDLLTDAGRLPEALSVLRDSAARHPDTAGPRRQFGIALLKSERPEQALEQLDSALAIEPGDQRAIAHRAIALQQLDRHDEADAYLGLDRHVYARQLACPAGFEDLTAFNRELARDIAAHSRLRWEPIGLAARNGALTDDLLADRTPAILGFAASLRAAIDRLRQDLQEDPGSPFLRSIPGADYRLNVWATLVEEGGNIDTHIHEESWLSGAYYVALPETLGASPEDPAGWIEFGRPHRGLPFSPPAATRLFKPHPGLLLLFPSYLFHRTIPHRGGQRRISISFDLSAAG